ncbi:hypothetical protein [Hymenobacter fastidiosus]
MKCPLTLLICLFGLGAGLTSCEEKETPEPTYYRFDAQDRAWLTARPGDELTFENQAGTRRHFRVGKVEERAHLASISTTLLGGIAREFYYDEWAMYLERTDSVQQVGVVTFTKARTTESAAATLMAQGFWYDYIGPETITDGVQCEVLNFPPDLNRAPLTPLTVGGQTYPAVLTMEVPTRRAGLCTYPFVNRTTHVYRLQYDRHAGIVRMESITGEVWSRVP